MMKRGDLYYVDLKDSIGCEQGGKRPVVIIQNDKGNQYSKTTIVASLTAAIFQKAILPTHVLISSRAGLKCNSIILLEQVRTIDKERLIKKIGELNKYELCILNRSLEISLGLIE